MADHDNDAVKRLQDSVQVFDEIMSVPDKAIPRELLDKAFCIGIIPSMKRGGFIFGGRYGKGVLLCRGAGGESWSGPSTIHIEGGSFGVQIGGGAVDLVFIVINQRGAERLIQSKFTFGADAAAMAGPVGRSAGAETDALMHAEILSDSRSQQVFAGVALEGSTLRPDDDDNRTIYDKAVSHRQILNHEVAATPSAKALIDVLTKYSPRKNK